jgi:hypothetical protein
METLLVLAITVKTLIKLKIEISSTLLQGLHDKSPNTVHLRGRKARGSHKMSLGLKKKTNSDSLPSVGDSSAVLTGQLVHLKAADEVSDRRLVQS